jgi:hypothetical protein
VNNYLLILGEAEALVWVLEENRMAFAPHRRTEAAVLRRGDVLFLYSTRGAFHNPSRDRGRVIGRAEVRGPLVELDPPMALGGRVFTSACDLGLLELAPFGLGVELSPLVPRLDAFPDPASWSARMRRPLVAISQNDAGLLGRALAKRAGEPAAALPTYRRTRTRVA